MKNIPILLLLLLVFGSDIFPQTKTYDIISYTMPSGWSRANRSGYRSYTNINEGKGTYGLIGIYPSAKSSGSAQKDFASSWNGLVMPYFGTGPAPIPSPVKKVDGYDELEGSAFGKSQGKQTTVMLVSYTGGGKTICIIINYNNFKYDADVTKFLRSIRLQSIDTATVKKD